MELALMFDLKVMEESAVMGIFCRRFALGQSLKLAQEIAKFPQQCMNVDRRLAYYSTFDAESWDAAMQYVFKNGMKVIQDEAVPGAASFLKGIGKHGLLNINKPSKL